MVTTQSHKSLRPIVTTGIVLGVMSASLYFALEMVRLAIPVVTPAPIEFSKTESPSWVTFEERR